MNESIHFIDRKTGKTKEEKIYCESGLRFLYGSGRYLGMILAKVPLISRLFGWWQRQPWTKRKVLPFVKKFEIDTSEFEKPVEQYPSFDAFFTRKLKPNARPLAEGIVIPADGRYLCYHHIDRCNGFVVKGKKFDISRLLNNRALADNYRTGSMVIARLCPTDYHRFHFPCDCIPGESQTINGPLFSVNPIAIKQNIEILTENKRVLTQLKTKNYGTILFIEVGATNVGSIHQTYQPHQHYRKGDEKGFFSFGGSSIILLFEAHIFRAEENFSKNGSDGIQLASDLLSNSSQHIETLCLFGQTLAK